MAASPLLMCRKFQLVEDRIGITMSLLHSLSPLLALIPDPVLLGKKTITPEMFILALERSCQIALKCGKVKAFLVSDNFDEYDPDLLISINSLISFNNKNVLQSKSMNIGICGYVAKCNKWHVKFAFDEDRRFHPDVDVMDMQSLPNFTVPVCNIHGEVLAVLQMTVGPLSPKFKIIGNAEDGMTFEHALQHLLRVITAPVQCVVSYIIGKGKENSSFNKNKSSLPSRSFKDAIQNEVLPEVRYTADTKQALMSDDDDDDDSSTTSNSNKDNDDIITSEEKYTMIITNLENENKELKSALHAVQDLYTAAIHDHKQSAFATTAHTLVTASSMRRRSSLLAGLSGRRRSSLSVNSTNSVPINTNHDT